MTRLCTRPKPEVAEPPKPKCGNGNPIYPAGGYKRETVDVASGPGMLAMRLTYDSSPMVPNASSQDPLQPSLGAFGQNWHGSLHRRLVLGDQGHYVTAERGDGHRVSFRGTGQGGFVAEGDVKDELRFSPQGGFIYVETATGLSEDYDFTGRLRSITDGRGNVTTFTYSTVDTPANIAPAPGHLISVQDHLGRQVRFEYEVSGDLVRVARIIDVAGLPIAVNYDGNSNLTSLTWQDSTTRTFIYERADLPWALTGVVDEQNSRKSTFGYDAQGRAVSTEYAGGVNRYSVTYDTAPTITLREVLDPLTSDVYHVRDWQVPANTQLTTPSGSSQVLGIENVAGTPQVTSRSQPAGSGCDASTSHTAYDSRGNVTSRDDFNGKRVCYGHDATRDLETVRVEGLTPAQSCTSYISAGAALPSGARKISTQWHPTWRQPIKVAEPGRIITTIYNGQPDPFAGGAVARCAPPDVTVVGVHAIPVVCKRAEQATTDEDGSQGLGAALQPGVPARIWSYTYNRNGQVLTENGPRTDVNDITTYEYYSDTTANWTRGDLKKITNAAAQVTQFTRYTPSGQPLESIDPNGVVTTHTYDARQRLITTTVAGQTTTYTYKPTGLLERVTSPDGSYVHYSYDAAHRLVGLADQLGNSITYTLDASGARTHEAVKDPAGVLARQASRIMDALGRVQQTTGAVH